MWGEVRVGRGLGGGIEDRHGTLATQRRRQASPILILLRVFWYRWDVMQTIRGLALAASGRFDGADWYGYDLFRFRCE